MCVSLSLYSLRTQASSLYSATPIGAPMHPAAIGVADRTRKIKLLAHRAWSSLPIGGGGHRCANILAHRSTSPQSRQSARLSLQSSELGPQLLNPQVSVSPPLVPGGGHTCLQERGWVGSQYWRTDKKKILKRGGSIISVRLVYFYPNCLLTGLYSQETEIL
jgi:hypothetical protein